MNYIPEFMQLKGMIELKVIKNENGFTLIEIILTLTIIVLVIPLASNMMVQSFNIFNSGIYRMNTRQRVELALDQISDYLRSATEIDEENNEFYSYNSSGTITKITLELAGDNPNDRNLLLNSGINSRIIAESVTSFSITESPKDSGVYEIKISYRVKEKESDGSLIREKSLKVYPKNVN